MPRVIPVEKNNAPPRTMESWGNEWVPQPEKGSRRIRTDSEGMWWPAGKNMVPNTRLKQLLALSARWHARTAISGFSSEDLDDLLQAALSCGSAVELIGKAYLASLNHSFIGEKADKDSLFMLAGLHGMIPTARATALRSISALDMIKLIKQIHTKLPIEVQDPVSLRVRNSSAHMGLVDATELRLGLIQMARVVDVILPLLELDPEPFWGSDLMPAVASLLDEASAEIARIIESKKARARARLAQLVKGFAAPEVAALMATLSGRFTSMSDHNEAQQCPVCKQSGWLLCNLERGEPVLDPEEGGGWVTQTAFPFQFQCPVCALDLDDNEILEFDFPQELQLEDDEATDDELWQPDEEDRIDHWDR